MRPSRDRRGVQETGGHGDTVSRVTVGPRAMPLRLRGGLGLSTRLTAASEPRHEPLPACRGRQNKHALSPWSPIPGGGDVECSSKSLPNSAASLEAQCRPGLHHVVFATSA
jgi:hypothetical protein